MPWLLHRLEGHRPLLPVQPRAQHQLVAVAEVYLCTPLAAATTAAATATFLLLLLLLLGR